MQVKPLSRKTIDLGGEDSFAEFITIGNLDYYKVQFISWIVLKRESGLRKISISEEHAKFE